MADFPLQIQSDDHVDSIIEILPLKCASLSISLPKNVTLNDSQISSFIIGKRIETTGVLLLRNTLDDMVIKMITISAPVCISRGTIDLATIDLGKTGHITSWKSIPFSFTVSNESEIPLVYEIECPEHIDIVSIGGTRG